MNIVLKNSSLSWLCVCVFMCTIYSLLFQAFAVPRIDPMVTEPGSSTTTSTTTMAATAKPAGMHMRSEFAVQMTCEACVSSVDAALRSLLYPPAAPTPAAATSPAATSPLPSYVISLSTQTVTIDSALPPSALLATLKSTGLVSVFRGAAALPTHSHDHDHDHDHDHSAMDTQPSSSTTTTAAAVCIFESFPGSAGQRGWAQHVNAGLARLVSALPPPSTPTTPTTPTTPALTPSTLVDVSVSGLPATAKTAIVAVHAYGDISAGLRSVGPRHTLVGTLPVDAAGAAQGVIELDGVGVWDLVGRSLCVTVDGGSGGEGGEGGEGEGDDRDGVCGVIARSAGVFGNTKRVCACSGATLWEEA
ncbi:superoxide dismutase [Entophlyctis helioformis]|nr:superoxide dismutase [Entophlyctis helioformis]